ncbi:MAG: phosphoribosylaminoimidazolesuccinocarboxamide synthase [Bacillota bacterium]|jgi:phosphoribosylaminoimidazole-succinocarboxamide synthase
MELLYKGKTKDVYDLKDGTYLLQFKDDVTGSDGIFDPGANEVVFQLAGAGKAALRLSSYFFELLQKENIPSHYLKSDLEQGTMTVMPATPFGHGVEVICRYRAVGSFLRRYGMYVQEGQPLDALVEFTLKDDRRQDPLICQEGLAMLGIMTMEESETVKKMTRRIGQIIKDNIAQKGLELYDIKLEFGRIGDGKEIALIDEISGGNMRVYQGGKYLDPLLLTEKILGEK